MNKKADMWAFNFLVAIGLIALILFGFFMLMSLIAPADVADVKASIKEINSGAGLINFFRMPEVMDSSVDCLSLRKALSSFYDSEVNYVLTVNDVKQCSRGELEGSKNKLDLILPDYKGNVNKITLEVEQ